MSYINEKVKERQKITPTSQTQPIGIVSEVPMNEWNAAIQYEKLNIVTYKSGTFIAKRPSMGIAPFDSVGWQEIWMPILNGVGIASAFTEYALGDVTSSEPPLYGWGNTIPQLQVGQYLWVRITINYTNGKQTVIYMVGASAVPTKTSDLLNDGDGKGSPFATVNAFDEWKQTISPTLAKAENAVQKTGDETIDGVKTFTSSVIVDTKSGTATLAPTYLDVVNQEEGGNAIRYGTSYIIKTIPGFGAYTYDFPNDSGTLALKKDISAPPLYLVEPLVEGSAGDFGDEPFLIPIANFSRTPVTGDYFSAWYRSEENNEIQLSVFHVESVDNIKATVSSVISTTQSTVPSDKYAQLTDLQNYVSKTGKNLVTGSIQWGKSDWSYLTIGATNSSSVPTINIRRVMPQAPTIDLIFDFPTSKNQGRYTLATTADIPSIPSLTRTVSGSGNAVTDITVSGHAITVTKGETFAKDADLSALATRVTTIEGKIPEQASTSDPLATRSFVNSSVQTATANFRGNWTTWAAVPTAVDNYPADYAGSKTPTVNDYLVVQNASDYSGKTLTGTWRFKYSGDWTTKGKNGWQPEYQVNETPLTSAQLAALNSGVTAELVMQIGTNKTDIASLKTSVAGKYTKPGGGIPTNDIADGAITSAKIADGTITKTDLATAVQTSLGKADTAVQPAALSDFITNSGNELITGVKTFSGLGAVSAGGYVNIFCSNGICIGDGSTSTSTIYIVDRIIYKNRNFLFPKTGGTLALKEDIPAEYILTKATTTAVGGVKVGGVRTSAITTTQGGTTSNRYYGVEVDSNGKAFVNVPWTDTHQSLANYYTKSETDKAISTAIENAITKVLNTPV